MRQNVIYAFGLGAAILLVRNLYVMFLQLPDEANQGAIYRIMFFHIPAWWTCFLGYFAAGVASVHYLWKRNPRSDAFAVAATEVGVMFTVIGLLTGTIWARNQWGIWWTWDARLTWALITWLIYSGYLMLRRGIDDPTSRAKNTAVLNIFNFTSVAITWKAIEWWRTQHPGPVLSLRGAKGATDAAMESVFHWNWLALLLLASMLVLIRLRQEEQQREVDSLRRMAHAF